MKIALHLVLVLAEILGVGRSTKWHVHPSCGNVRPNCVSEPP